MGCGFSNDKNANHVDVMDSEEIENLKQDAMDERSPDISIENSINGLREFLQIPNSIKKITQPNTSACRIDDEANVLLQNTSDLKDFPIIDHGDIQSLTEEIGPDNELTNENNIYTFPTNETISSLIVSNQNREMIISQEDMSDVLRQIDKMNIRELGDEVESSYEIERIIDNVGNPRTSFQPNLFASRRIDNRRTPVLLQQPSEDDSNEGDMATNTIVINPLTEVGGMGDDKNIS